MQINRAGTLSLNYQHKAPPAAFVERSRRPINLLDFQEPYKLADLAIASTKWNTNELQSMKNILRMPIRDLGPRVPFITPSVLEPIDDLIKFCRWYQFRYLTPHPFWYVTIRTETERPRSSAIHVDGFSMRTPHVPQTSYVVCTDEPTEFWTQGVTLPADFDGKVHNIHTYLESQLRHLEPEPMQAGVVHLLDPYMPHRRPLTTSTRTMIRISNVPIEIEDDNHTPNPDYWPGRRFGRSGKQISDAFIPYPG